MNPIRNKKLISMIKDANSILLCTHLLPDGDAIGSLLALGHLFRETGKKVTLVCHNPVPKKMLFLPGAEEVLLPAAVKEEFDLGLSVDVSTFARLGDAADLFARCPHTVQIDHHADNTLYAQENEVDGEAAAAGCLVWRLIHEMDLPLSKNIAACLYTAISTDTGNFTFSSVNEEVFQCAAELVGTGMDLGAVARNLHALKELPHLKLLGRALDSLTLFAENKCAGMILTKEDFLFANALPEHTETIVNYALNIPGVQMSYLADVSAEGQTRVSLRCVPPYDVSSIAKELGGGGHTLASGLRTELPAREVIARIVQGMTNQVTQK